MKDYDAFEALRRSSGFSRRADSISEADTRYITLFAESTGYADIAFQLIPWMRDGRRPDNIAEIGGLIDELCLAPSRAAGHDLMFCIAVAGLWLSFEIGFPGIMFDSCCQVLACQADRFDQEDAWLILNLFRIIDMSKAQSSVSEEVCVIVFMIWCMCVKTLSRECMGALGLHGAGSVRQHAPSKVFGLPCTLERPELAKDLESNAITVSDWLERTMD